LTIWRDTPFADTVERPCSYCVKTGHASSCEVEHHSHSRSNKKYNGLEALIRFDKKSIACAKPSIPRRKPPKKDQGCPEKDTSTDITMTSIPSSPSADSISSSARSTPPPPPQSLQRWTLCNGTGFETRDVPFIHYFLDRFPGDRWFSRLAAPIASYMMANSLNAPVLHHATICVSALLASNDPFSQPVPAPACIERYFEHKQKALQLARHHLETDDICASLAVAIVFLLISEKSNPTTRRVHMHGLKSVLQHLQVQLSDEGNKDLSPNLTPLYWLSWCMGVRFDVSLAIIGVDPILDPLPLTTDYESHNRTWITHICGPTMPADEIEFAVLLCTVRMFLHRAFHIAAMARKYRTSPGYAPRHEAKIQRLCHQLDQDLDTWMARRLTQQNLFEVYGPPNEESISFLNYPPVPVLRSQRQNLMTEYHFAKLYVSFLSVPEVGPGPPELGRFEHALEICRNLVAVKIDPRWNHFLAEYAKLFEMFLCCLAFGGTDYYPEESRGVIKLIEDVSKVDCRISVQDVFHRWVQHCPGLPPISLEKFPWIASADGFCADTFFDGQTDS